MTVREAVQRTVRFDASPACVWEAITTPERMASWMADFPLRIDVTWRAGEALHMTGDLHGLPFENRGTVLGVVLERSLRFTYWTSLSGRPYSEADIPVVQFTLRPVGTGTWLEVTHGNVPAGPERQHLPFYWNAALLKLGDVLAATNGSWVHRNDAL